jgi:O-methyltransferase
MATRRGPACRPLTCPPVDPADAYIDLLKRAVSHSLYSGPDALGYPPPNPLHRMVKGYYRRRNVEMVQVLTDQEEKRERGDYWPLFAQTMIGRKRLDNVQECVDTILRDGVPGDLIETGVWRGGSVIFMRGMLRARGVTDRTVWVADSFEGLPPPNLELYPQDADSDDFHTMEELRVSLEDVQENFRRYGLLDDQVKFLQGWFKDTLPTLGDERFALIRLDGDMYESTMDALTNLYPRLEPGGFTIIDDYGMVPCRQAVADYRAEHGIEDEIVEIDVSGSYWRKSG